MKPWLTAIGTPSSAKAPIVARDVMQMLPAGYNGEEMDARPASVIVRSVCRIYGPASAVTSVGVSHCTSPPQYSGTFERGVPPPPMVATSVYVRSDRSTSRD